MSIRTALPRFAHGRGLRQSRRGSGEGVAGDAASSAAARGTLWSGARSRRCRQRCPQPRPHLSASPGSPASCPGKSPFTPGSTGLVRQVSRRSRCLLQGTGRKTTAQVVSLLEKLICRVKELISKRGTRVCLTLTSPSCKNPFIPAPAKALLRCLPGGKEDPGSSHCILLTNPAPPPC